MKTYLRTQNSELYLKNYSGVVNKVLKCIDIPIKVSKQSRCPIVREPDFKQGLFTYKC